MLLLAVSVAVLAIADQVVVGSEPFSPASVLTKLL